MKRTKTIKVIVTETITLSEVVEIDVTPDDDDHTIDQKARAKYMAIPFNERTMISSDGLDLDYTLPEREEPKRKAKK